jgi:HK97 gp10 family phage protein
VAADDVKGLSELAKLLDKLPAKIQRNVLLGAVDKAAESLVAPMQAAAPVWTGHLEESITHRKAGSSGKVFGRNRSGRATRSQNSDGVVSAGIVFKTPGKFYWHLLEFGTVRMAARPFVRPTFAANQGRILQAMKTYIGKRLEREARKAARETGAKK